jgi:hypothetical protein
VFPPDVATSAALLATTAAVRSRAYHNPHLSIAGPNGHTIRAAARPQVRTGHAPVALKA